MEVALHDINEQAEVNEEEKKDERKRRREEDVPPGSSSWVCEEDGCEFVGQTRANLVNHVCQRHGWMVGLKETCPFCSQIFGRQGIGMCKRFCPARTSR